VEANNPVLSPDAQRKDMMTPRRRPRPPPPPPPPRRLLRSCLSRVRDEGSERHLSDTAATPLRHDIDMFKGAAGRSSCGFSALAEISLRRLNDITATEQAL